MTELQSLAALLGRLAAMERREVITTDPSEAEKCCGIERDEDGFCQHRPGHPVYVPLRETEESRRT